MLKAAATRGVSRRKILLRHVLHNALPPVIPRLGLQYLAGANAHQADHFGSRGYRQGQHRQHHMPGGADD
jgi:ABC-type microcin C transport system permease subunit YejE